MYVFLLAETVAVATDVVLKVARWHRAPVQQVMRDRSCARGKEGFREWGLSTTQ